MKSKLKRGAALLLATATCLTTMVGSALAASPTFKDVPETHWAYSYVERAATDGIVNGVSPSVFSPSTQVTSAQFFAMVERVCMPDAGWTAGEGTWYEPYWNMASAEGYNLVKGTAITKNNFNAAISRYDMAQALYNYNNISEVGSNGFGGLYGITPASPSQIKDYNSIPEKYRTAVLWAYGAGALKGDEKGNFNGSNVMNRAEAATVMVRMEDIIKACDKAEADANMKAVLEHSKTSLYDNYQKVTYSDGRVYTKEYVDLLKENAANGYRLTGNAKFAEGTYEIPVTVNFRDEDAKRNVSHLKFTAYILDTSTDFGEPEKWIPVCEYVFDESTNLKNKSGTFTFLIPASTYKNAEREVKIIKDDCYAHNVNWVYPGNGTRLPYDYKMSVDPDNCWWTLASYS